MALDPVECPGRSCLCRVLQEVQEKFLLVKFDDDFVNELAIVANVVPPAIGLILEGEDVVLDSIPLGRRSRTAWFHASTGAGLSLLPGLRGLETGAA